MNSPILPILCGAALAAMSTAGISHYCAVRQFVAAIENDAPSFLGLPPVAPAVPDPSAPAPAADPAPRTLAKSPSSKPANPGTKLPAAPRQEEFFETLISRLENLQNQNRDLQDQLAETNRDLMKLEFRVDTHSESFRPLPISEQIQDTSFGDEPGVLPPRADPVSLPSFE